VPKTQFFDHTSQKFVAATTRLWGA